MSENITDEGKTDSAAHTPGPWKVGRKFEVGPVSKDFDQSEGMILPLADVYGENREADAHLIARAPDMAAEVAKLRSDRDRYKAEFEMAVQNCAKLRAKNERLRTIAESIASRGCNHCNEAVSKARIDLGIYPDPTPPSPEVR